MSRMPTFPSGVDPKPGAREAKIRSVGSEAFHSTVNRDKLTLTLSCGSSVHMHVYRVRHASRSGLDFDVQPTIHAKSQAILI